MNDNTEYRDSEPKPSPTEPSVAAGQEPSLPAGAPAPARRHRVHLVTAAALAVLVILAVLYVRRSDPPETRGEKSPAPASGPGTREEAGEAGEGSDEGEAREVALTPEGMKAADIEMQTVTQRPAVALLHVTGSVEANQQETQQATPLVSGRVEHVNVALGETVRAGATLAVIASPEIAELQGKLRGAATRQGLAERNLARVEQAENRAGVIAAKAKLDEAEATLRRTRKLVELGAGAGKDLIAAETEYTTAKAEYDYQSNIALNREVQEARAALDEARSEVDYLRGQLRALGAPDLDPSAPAGANLALVALRAPVSGTVTERLVNPGAGVQAGQAMLTISNTATVWVIANVPEADVRGLRVGAPAEVSSPAVGDEIVPGRVSYIDPRLDEATRTARVRVEVANGGSWKTGMFVDVGLQVGARGSATPSEQELVVPSLAVQRLEDRTVVFVPEAGEPGHFKVRDVKLGAEIEGYRRVVSGLALGETIVTKGSFSLKAQLMKGELGEDDE